MISKCLLAFGIMIYRWCCKNANVGLYHIQESMSHLGVPMTKFIFLLHHDFLWISSNFYQEIHEEWNDEMKFRNFLHLNTLRQRQNGRRFADDTSKCIFLMKMSEFRLRFHWFVPKGPINNILALVQIMAWCRPGDKTLSEPIMVSLLMHICIFTRPQWAINILLTPKQLEMHGCVPSTVAIDILVLKYQAISTHTAEQIFLVQH